MLPRILFFFYFMLFFFTENSKYNFLKFLNINFDNMWNVKSLFTSHGLLMRTRCMYVAQTSEHSDQDQASYRAIIILLILINSVQLLLLFWVYFVYKMLMRCVYASACVWCCLDECMMLKNLEYFKIYSQPLFRYTFFCVFDCVYSHYLNSNKLFVFGFSIFNILSNDHRISVALCRAHTHAHRHTYINKQVDFLPNQHINKCPFIAFV